MDNDFLIISDEIYEKIIYDKKHYSPAKYSDNVVTLNGFSKTYAMTGLRIGYLNANENYTEELLKIHQYNIACASTTSQMGAYAALTGPQDDAVKMVNEFQRRRDLIVSRLNEMGYETVNAEGAFYVFPNITGFGMSSVETAEYILEKTHVVTAPGSAFGDGGEGYIRICYASKYEDIQEALRRMEEAFGTKKK
jgi:aspartate aminotransferase